MNDDGLNTTPGDDGMNTTPPPPSPPTLWPLGGDFLDGWRKLRLLGEGGCGRVYLATRKNLTAALKVIKPALANKPDWEERFKREIEILYLLRKHGSSIVKILAFGHARQADGSHAWYIAMEYVEGMSLQEYLQRFGALTPVQACRLFGPLAQALALVHAEGVWHRDIKPTNILVRCRGPNCLLDSPVLIDWGIAKSVHAQDLTGAGEAPCTFVFAAPEQQAPGGSSRCSDVYSLAGTLYFALMYRHSGHRLPCQFRPDLILDAEVADLLRQALDVNPEKRPTACAFADRLAAIRRRLEQWDPPGPQVT